MDAIYIPQLTKAPERTEEIQVKEFLPGLETLTPVRGRVRVQRGCQRNPGRDPEDKPGTGASGCRQGPDGHAGHVNDKFLPAVRSDPA